MRSKRDDIDRSQRLYKYKPRPKPERTVGLHLYVLAPPKPLQALGKWVSRCAQGISWSAAKALRRARQGQNSTPSLELILHVFGLARPSMVKTTAVPSDFLNKAAAVRQAWVNRITKACGGYTGTVVARHDTDVKQVGPSEDGSRENKGKQKGTMPHLTMPSPLSLVVKFKHNNASDSGRWFVGITSGMFGAACNLNVPNENFTEEYGEELKNQEINQHGVNAVFGNPANKEGMPVGFRIGQLRPNTGGSFMSCIQLFQDGQVKTFIRYKTYPGFKEYPAMFPNSTAVQLFADTLNMGVSDRVPNSNEKVPDGECRQIREDVRSCLLNGTSKDYGAHGMVITQVGPRSLNDLLKDPGVKDTRTGVETRRHFFVIVGHMSDEDWPYMLSKGEGTQLRIYCDQLQVYHVHPNAIHDGGLFGPTIQEILKKQSLASLIPGAKQPEPVAPIQETAPKEDPVGMVQTTGITRRTKAAVSVAQAQREEPAEVARTGGIARRSKPTPAPSVQPNTLDPAGVAGGGGIVRRKHEALKPSSAEAELATPTEIPVTPVVLESVVEPPAPQENNLEAYYKAASLSVYKERSENALSAQEVINHFDVVSNPDLVQKAKAILRLPSPQQGARAASASSMVANAVRLYLLSHLTDNTFQGEVYALNLSEYPWSVENVKDIVQIMQGVGSKNNLKDMPYITEEGDTTILHFGEEVGFRIKDGFVYDKRGRMISNMLELVVEERVIKGKNVPILQGVEYVSSIGGLLRLVYFGYLPLLVQSFTDTISSLSANFYAFCNDEFVNAKVDGTGLVKFTSDRVEDQNGAALHRIKSQYSVLVHAKCSPFQGNDWKRWTAEESAGRFARVLSDHYQTQVKDFDIREFWPTVIEHAIQTYNLDFVFSKKSFVRGSLSHVNLELLQKHAPELHKKISSKFGLENSEYVISGTTKPAKGFKRIALPLAQSAAVENSKPAGWKLYNQEYFAEGSLQPEAFFPTLALPPGISLWLGSEEELPVGLLNKTSRCFKIGVQPDTKPVFGVGCVLQEGNYTERKVEDVDGTWQELTPINPVFIKRDPQLKGNPTIAEVVIGGITTFVQHESVYSGKLNYVRYRVRKNMQLSSSVYELDVVWSITTRENWPKVRSIAKAMLLGAQRSCVMLPEEIKVNIVHGQDGTKADTLYAWLMVIGNTIKYNPGRPEIAALAAEAKRINTLLGEPEFDGLLIELIHVVAGEYDHLQNLFRKTFGRAVEVRLKDVSDLGRMFYDMHQSDDYELLPAESYGPNCFVRKGEDPKNVLTNITRFVKVNDEITEIHQRCFGFIGLPNCPVYNIELFESSTVMEAVSESCMFPASVRSMRYTSSGENPEVMNKLIMSMVNDMDTNLFKLKAMLQFSIGGEFNAKHKIELVQNGEFFHLQPGDRQMILERLAPLNLKAKRGDSALAFKLVAEALSDCVFLFTINGRRTSIFLPALRKFNQLGSTNENTETLSSVFYESALKPLIMNPHGVQRAVLGNIRGKLDTMVRSKEARKLLKGRSKVTAKRVGMPCVPAGETWVLYSEATDSLYTQLTKHARRLDIKFDVHGTYVGYNGRDPMAAGWFTKLRVISPEENAKSFWHMGAHTFAISPAAVYIDGGDFDGDPHTFSLIGGEELLKECMTYERMLKIRSTAMGTNVLFSGSYAFDHYTRKDFLDATRTMESANYKKAIATIKDYVSYNVGAHTVQNVAVGQGFKFCMIAENIIELSQALQKSGLPMPAALKTFADDNAYRIVLATAELYEIMLGGYSKAAENLYNKFLHPAIKEGKPFSSYLQSQSDHNALKQVITEYGGSTECYSEMLQVMDVVAMTQQIELTGNLPGHFSTDVLLGSVVCSALFSFEITRDKFGGFCGALSTFRRNNLRSLGHKRAMDYCYAFMGNTLMGLHGFGQFKEFINNSHVLSSVRRMFRYLDAEIGVARPQDWPVHSAWPQEFLNSFTQQLSSKVDEPAAEATKESEESKEIVKEPTEPKAEQDWFEGLTKDQIRAFQYVMAGRNVMISGEAGTGKTYITKRIWEYFEEQQWKVLVTGSTGVSVMNIEGHGTVNSSFGLGLGFTGHEPTGEQAGKILANARASNLCRSNLTLELHHKGLFIIIDEVGFLDTKIIALVSKIVRESGVKVQWLFVGDPGQCSPVGGDLFFKPFSLEYTSQPAKTYGSFLKTGDFTCVILQEPVRQAQDLSFLNSLRNIRKGEKVDSVLLSRYKHSLEFEAPEEAIHAFYNNEDVLQHNLTKTQELIDKGHEHRVYKAKIKRLSIRDDKQYNRFLQSFYPIEAQMTLCVGMPVMIRKNIKDESLRLLAANGTVGVITKLFSDGVNVKLDNGSEVLIQEEDLEGPRGRDGKPLGKFKQLPLHPAFALTGHKLQGLTLTRPLVVHSYQRSGGFKKEVHSTGWLYVVCSRVTTSDLLWFDASEQANLVHLVHSVSADQEALKWVEEQAAQQS